MGWCQRLHHTLGQAAGNPGEQCQHPAPPWAGFEVGMGQEEHSGEAVSA